MLRTGGLRWTRTPYLRGSGPRALCRLHPLELEDLRLGLELFEESTRLELRDALHAATALNRGIGLIVSTDRAFDGVAGLERVDPLNAVERLTER